MRPPNKSSDSGSESHRLSAEDLARTQGVKPIGDISELKGDFWPHDENLDEFLKWLRTTRNEDRLAS